MKHLRLILGMLLLLQVSASAEQVSKPEFEMITPANWSQSDKPLPFETLFIARAAGEDPYRPSVHVMINRGSSNLDGFVKGQKMMLDGTAEDLKFKPGTFAGKPGGVYSYTINGKLKTVIHYALVGDVVYQLALNARTDDQAKSAKAFKSVVDSFKFKK